MTLCEEHAGYFVLYGGYRKGVQCPACGEKERADNEIEDLKDQVSTLTRELRERGETL